MADDLQDLMEFDHVIRVHTDRSITEPTGVYAPELHMRCTDAGDILPEHDRQYTADAAAQGWTVLTGFTGQSGYSGLLMHPSEYIGGGLATHIRETPGWYVAVVVDTYPPGDGESEPAGWAIAHRAAGAWVIGDNAPGRLPDTADEASAFADRDDAVRALSEVMRAWADEDDEANDADLDPDHNTEDDYGTTGALVAAMLSASEHVLTGPGLTGDVSTTATANDGTPREFWIMWDADAIADPDTD